MEGGVRAEEQKGMNSKQGHVEMLSRGQVSEEGILDMFTSAHLQY